MKNILKISFSLLAIGLMSCEAELDNPVTDEGFFTTGEANMSNYVAVGNSLTAGYADGALYITGQNNSYPNIMAEQFARAGGSETFTQPLMADNLGGLFLNGTQVASNRLVLGTDANGNPTPVVLEGMATTEVEAGEAGPYNNMGIPGAKSFHLLSEGYGDASGVLAGTANPYYARIATSASSTVIGDAIALNPSFFSLWIGNNDILSYATSGGVGVDQTGNLDPTTYGSNDITDPMVFAGAYSTQVDLLVGTGASGGALVNIPDVTSIPYFTTVPVNPIPLDAATAALVNSQFALYNTQVLPGLVQFQIITPEEAAARMVNFSEGLNNYPIIMDDDLTDISMILQAPPFSLDPQTAGLLGQLRQANDDDLIVLPASSVIGSLADPSNPLSVNGVAIPLADQYVLTAAEQARVATAAASYNATIQGLAAANDLVYVDAKAALAQVANTGVAFDGGILADEYVTGGAFSLDGVHPSPRGYAYTANLIIQGINAKYNATIPLVNIGNYGTVQVTSN
ncbi:MAG: G-D-S-L family lipolytic protein [Flavobacteriaceae bacterium]|nr:G-D-S-L family lipolytic protein [Flavobacteriaceae bacterium]